MQYKYTKNIHIILNIYFSNKICNERRDFMNITKQTVYTNETILEQTIEQPIDTDFTLPDYCPEIVKILKCRVVPKLNSKAISGGSLNIDGIAFVTLVYRDENDKICCFEHEVNFQKNIPIENNSNEICSVDIFLNNEYMNCRAITSRKMDIHGVVSIKVKISGNKGNEIVADIDMEDIQLKRENLPATNPLGMAEKIVVLEEELELNIGNNSIKSILRSDSRAIVEDCKLVSNKAVIKGYIVINVLYCTDDERIEFYENRIPFNQIVDMNIEGIDCRLDGKVSIMSCIIKPRTNLSGEAKSFALECKICLTAMASCENDIPVVFDVYSTKYNAELDSNTMCFRKLDSVLNEKYICKKTLEFSEDTFGSVVDLWCENRIGNIKLIDKTINIMGTVLICLLTYDKQGVPQYYERGVDFEYIHNIETESDGLICEASLETISSSYSILDSDKLEVRVELSVDAEIFSCKNKSVITNINIDRNNLKAKRKCPLVVYYADKGESLWEIAKHYNANCKSMKEINNLSDDILKENTMLLIP